MQHPLPEVLGLLHHPAGRPPSFWVVLLVTLACALPGCQPDESPLKAEIETMHRQLSKQESVILSLQEGNKVMQQQINLLNGELRDAQSETKIAVAEREKLRVALDSLAAKNRKLSATVKRALAKNAEAAKAIRVNGEGAQTREVLHTVAATSQATVQALSRNGYSVRVSARTDTRAVYVTDRKVSEPASLEVPGFRNQYVVALHSLPSEGTLVSVKADFERTRQDSRVIAAGPEETAEIETRLIAEIVKILVDSRRSKR